jgi:hypothetical protein
MEVVLIYTATYQEKKLTTASKSKCCGKKVMSYFTKETITDEWKHIAAEEGLFYSTQ